VNETRFPSGMQALADYIHKKGLKFGLYSSSGKKTCQGFPGSWGYWKKDAETYAGWDVDYFKLDCCYQSQQDEKQISFDSMSEALNATGRPIVFSCDSDELLLRVENPEFPWLWGPSKCNLARIWYDIWDSWLSTMDIIDHAVGLTHFSGPGFWNDLDILTVGMSKQSDIEYQTHFSLWCVLSSPLIMGHDVPSSSKITLNILKNKEAIAVNQYSGKSAGSRIRTSIDGTQQVFGKPLAADNTYAILLLNRADQPQDLTFLFEDVYGNKLCCPPPPPSYSVDIYDIWQHQDLGLFNTTYVAKQVPSHGSVLLRVTKVD